GSRHGWFPGAGDRAARRRRERRAPGGMTHPPIARRRPRTARWKAPRAEEATAGAAMTGAGLHLDVPSLPEAGQPGMEIEDQNGERRPGHEIHHIVIAQIDRGDDDAHAADGDQPAPARAESPGEQDA